MTPGSLATAEAKAKSYLRGRASCLEKYLTPVGEQTLFLMLMFSYYKSNIRMLQKIWKATEQLIISTWIPLSWSPPLKCLLSFSLSNLFFYIRAYEWAVINNLLSYAHTHTHTHLACIYSRFCPIPLGCLLQYDSRAMSIWLYIYFSKISLLGINCTHPTHPFPLPLKIKFQ